MLNADEMLQAGEVVCKAKKQNQDGSFVCAQMFVIEPASTLMNHTVLETRSQHLRKNHPLK
jgi:hypothetical protein